MDSETAIQLLEAQRQVWDHSFAYIKTMAVQSAMELDIPRVVQNHGKPITVGELGSALKIARARAPFLARLMRMLAHMGYFVVENLKDGDDETAASYSATLMCGFLVKDKPFNAATWFVLANDPILVDPWRSFGAWIRQPPAGAAGAEDLPFAMAHNGKKLYEVCRDVPRMGKMMSEGTESDSWMFSKALLAKCGSHFQGLKSIVDVGGNTGTISKAIAEAFPGIHCTVCDLAQVVSGLESTQPNLNYVVEDMFQKIPPVDAVFLKWVLCDWGDESCVKILKQAKEAVTSSKGGGKVMRQPFRVEEKRA
ncbi:unnamed protein product [Linum tenue]|uniref:Uncharacterized protein n=1 Tax=Linum tenue TaxID=586396 RepID=A0AAV0KES7_9ROSI|nr:unnamed protein product [Linum tenue]